jgi:predicted TIM-barrel fold metal-dependent hydrolase
MPTSSRIIDAHAHIWPHGLVHPDQRDSRPIAATPADLLATLDANGVDAVIVSPAAIYPDNEYVLGAAASAPDRIFAVVSVDPREPLAVRSVPALAARGAVGVRVNTRATQLTTDLDLAGLDALIDLVAATGLVIQWTIPLSATGFIERAANRAPKLRQVLDHLGLPANARDLTGLGQIQALATLSNLSIKLSGMHALSHNGYPYRDVWPWAEGVVSAFGPDRTMWASDWPLSTESASYAEHLGVVAILPFLHDVARRAVKLYTAARIWQRDGVLAEGG